VNENMKKIPTCNFKDLFGKNKPIKGCCKIPFLKGMICIFTREINQNFPNVTKNSPFDLPTKNFRF